MYVHGYDLRHFFVSGIVPATVTAITAGTGCWTGSRTRGLEADRTGDRAKLASMLLVGHTIATSGTLLKTGLMFGMNPLALNWAQLLAMVPVTVAWIAGRLPGTRGSGAASTMSGSAFSWHPRPDETSERSGSAHGTEPRRWRVGTDCDGGRALHPRLQQRGCGGGLVPIGDGSDHPNMLLAISLVALPRVSSVIQTVPAHVLDRHPVRAAGSSKSACRRGAP